jgi:hypothetical protein
MSGIEIDKSNSRIWLLRYPETFRLGDFRQLFVDVQRLNPERYKHTVLIDMSRIQPLSATAEIRREAAEVVAANMEHLVATTVAEARVAPNPLIRGMLTVFDWLQPKPWGINNVVTGPAAELWLRSQLERSGIEVPVAPVWPTPPMSKKSA